MTRIGNTRRVNFKKVKYGKGLYNFLPRAMKNPPPEYNILTQTALDSFKGPPMFPISPLSLEVPFYCSMDHRSAIISITVTVI